MASARAGPPKGREDRPNGRSCFLRKSGSDGIDILQSRNGVSFPDNTLPTEQLRQIAQDAQSTSTRTAAHRFDVVRQTMKLAMRLR